MKLKIHINEQVLIDTRYCNHDPGRNCAVSYAVREIFPDANVIQPQYFRTMGIIINLPNNASEFIKEFDLSNAEERTKMPPFSFEIDIPRELIDKINIKDIEKSQTLELV